MINLLRRPSLKTMSLLVSSALLAGGGYFVTEASASGASQLLRSAATLPAQLGPHHARPPLVTDFPNYINTIGTVRYPDTFAGVDITSGATIIYVKKGSPDASLLTFIADAASVSKAAYTVVNVPKSYSELDGTATQLGNASIRNEGITVITALPSAATGTIDVAIAAPTATTAAGAAQAQVAKGSSPSTDYQTNVRQLLAKQFSGITLESNYGSIANGKLENNRRQDTSPFYGGDFIGNIEQNGTITSYTQCTSGFPMTGPNGNYATTAGHCLGGSWGVSFLFDGPHFVGNVDFNANYMGVDVERIPSSVLPTVWGGPADAPVTYSIFSEEVPSIGAPIAWDGSNQRERRNRIVTNNNACQSFPSPVGYVCHLVSGLESDVGTLDGDSGGPVYQHTCYTCNSVNAIGTIIGIQQFSGNNQYYSYADQVQYEESALGTNLYT